MRMLAWVNLLVRPARRPRPHQQAPRRHPVLRRAVNWGAGDVAHITVILGLVYGYIPFFILPLYAALDRIDGSQLEAARDLGGSPRSTFWRVTLPLSKQGIIAGTVIIMLPMFGDYYTPDLMSAQNKTRIIGNQIELPDPHDGEGARGRLAHAAALGVRRRPDALLPGQRRSRRPGGAAMSVDRRARGRPPTSPRHGSAGSSASSSNPWGRPRFLARVHVALHRLVDRAGRDRGADLVQRRPIAEHVPGVQPPVVPGDLRPKPRSSSMRRSSRPSARA